MTFLGANIIKIPPGGWFPLVVAALIFIVMTTWKTGRWLVAVKCAISDLTIDDVLVKLKEKSLPRVPGTAVFLSSDPAEAPAALLTHVFYNRVLSEQVVLLTVASKEVAHVTAAEQLQVEPLGEGVHRLLLTFRFMDEPDVPRALAEAAQRGLSLDPQTITYFIGRSTVIASNIPGMALWREKLFALLTRNAAAASDYFSLPPQQVVELGTRVEF